jgi:hypothetical protein
MAELLDAAFSSQGRPFSLVSVHVPASGGSQPAIRRHSERPGGPWPTGRTHIAASKFEPYIKSYIMRLFRFVKGPGRPMRAALSEQRQGSTGRLCRAKLVHWR